MENFSDESVNVEQKLVDFAVSIAKEAGELTLSLFNDLNLEIIKNSIPTKTFSTSLDVAKMIHYLFFEAKNINGADIDINGGHY